MPLIGTLGTVSVDVARKELPLVPRRQADTFTFHGEYPLGRTVDPVPNGHGTAAAGRFAGAWIWDERLESLAAHGGEQPRLDPEAQLGGAATTKAAE